MFALALILVTFMHVVFGEMVPKNIAFSIPERAALVLGPLAPAGSTNGCITANRCRFGKLA